MKHIFYKEGYKYQLAEEYSISVPIKPKTTIMSDFILLTTKGELIINKGYAWDGPSGPTIDTKNFMRGSLVHDALYQLMKEKSLDRKKYRKIADKILIQCCKEDGMNFIRRSWVYTGVRLFAGFAANPINKKIIKKAP